jgi:gamma-glutamylcyclotransferase (GGCT)/AIG2-like uncharacterized protein YtfP
MIYFAYGSNMDPVQMRTRCAGSRALGPGVLAEHRLCFSHWSEVRGHAAASIEPAAGEQVWGVLYEMTPGDWTRLHVFEGHLGDDHPENGYDLRPVEIAAETEVVAARAYVSRPDPRRPQDGLPSAHYVGLLINGAVSHGLPADYLARLRAIETCD